MDGSIGEVVMVTGQVLGNRDVQDGQQGISNEETCAHFFGLPVEGGLFFLYPVCFFDF